MALTHLGLYDTVSLLCSSFALNSVRKPMESTLEWYFCLVWFPSAFNFIFFHISCNCKFSLDESYKNHLCPRYGCHAHSTSKAP